MRIVITVAPTKHSESDSNYIKKSFLGAITMQVKHFVKAFGPIISMTIED